MAFKVDFSQATDYSQIVDGTYEIIVSSAKTDQTKNGKDHIAMNLVVRNDIDQPHKNQFIFDKMFPNSETGKYNMGRIMNMAKIYKLVDGKEYNSLDEFLSDFVGKVARVTVKNEEYNGYTNLNVKRIEETKFPQVGHTWKEAPAQTTATAPVISDDNLPF
jgi:hypothetical protein